VAAGKAPAAKPAPARAAAAKPAPAAPAGGADKPSLFSRLGRGLKSLVTRAPRSQH
jgi:ATP-dependent RNA helicase RhlB